MLTDEEIKRNSEMARENSKPFLEKLRVENPEKFQALLALHAKKRVVAEKKRGRPKKHGN